MSEQSQTRKSEMTKEKADKYFQDIKEATYKAWTKDEEFPSVVFVIQEKAGSRILGKASSYDMLMAFGNMFKEAFRLNPVMGFECLRILTEEVEEMLKAKLNANTKDVDDDPSDGERQWPR